MDPGPADGTSVPVVAVGLAPELVALVLEAVGRPGQPDASVTFCSSVEAAVAPIAARAAPVVVAHAQALGDPEASSWRALLTAAAGAPVVIVCRNQVDAWERAGAWAAVRYDGDPAGLRGTLRRALELAAARGRLAVARRERRDTIDSLPHGLFRVSQDGRLLEANAALARICGYGTPAELLAAVPDLRRLSADPEEAARLERLLRERDRVDGFGLALRRRDGTAVGCSLASRILLGGGEGRAAGFECIAADVTGPDPVPDTLLATRVELERRVQERTSELEHVNQALVAEVRERLEAERQLRDSEERYRALAHNSRDVIMRFDRRGRHLYVNASVEAVTGLPPAAFLGRTHREIGFPGPLLAVWEPAIQKVFADGKVHRVEFQLPTGVWIDWLLMPEFADDGSVQCVVTAARDITERKHAEELLRKAHDELGERVARRTEELQRAAELLRGSEKLRAIGQLAGGVAHDFNNLLQALLGSVSLLRRRREDPPACERLLGQIEADIARGAALARQLLLFARREVTRFEDVDLNAVLLSGGQLLRRLVRENVELRLDLCPGSLPVRVDRGQIEQVLVNLVLNGCDAIAGGGLITVSSGDGPPGSAWFEVRDDGEGIAPEHLSRIFEPFFTTKGRDKGAGLGLSVVHGIVEAHGGRVDVRSAAGFGTSFRIRLPGAAAPANPLAAAPAAAETLPVAHGERVLLVEDEPSTRSVLEELLRSLGYAVLAVGNAEDALALPSAPAFDLLLTDLMLPGIGGRELAARLRARWPGLVVVVASGYSHAPPPTADEGVAASLSKPFDQETLSRALRSVLGARRTSAGGSAA